MIAYRAECDCGHKGPPRATEALAEADLEHTHPPFTCARCGGMYDILVDDGPLCIRCDAIAFEAA